MKIQYFEDPKIHMKTFFVRTFCCLRQRNSNGIIVSLFCYFGKFSDSVWALSKVNIVHLFVCATQSLTHMAYKNMWNFFAFFNKGFLLLNFSDSKSKLDRNNFFLLNR